MEDVTLVLDGTDASGSNPCGADESNEGAPPRRTRRRLRDPGPTVPSSPSNGDRVPQPEEPAALAPPVAADESAAPAPAASEHELAGVIESLLFSSDGPLSSHRLADLSGASAATVLSAIESLNEKYAQHGLSFRISPIAAGWQMMTLPQFQPWIAKLDGQRAQNRLGDAALETLAVIAYRQPIIRAEIEAIRGVACGEVLSRLRELGLIRIAGRAEVVGRPLLYATTKKFLDVFGLSGLEDLPAMEQLPNRTLDFTRESPPTEAESTG